MTDGLAAALAAELGAEVTNLERLSGGASRETWAFEIAGRRLVLRRDPPGAMASGLIREADLLRAAETVGVPVPGIVASGESLAGAPFIVMEHVAGETIPRKLLRDDEFASARPQLAAQCGRILAAIHRIPAEEVPGLPDEDVLSKYRAAYDMFEQPHAAFELAFRWLAEHRPDSPRRTVVHGDFRNGNLMVGRDGIRAVLDWELAHVGDPIEDLGWLCARAWRFGSPMPVGGFGEYDDLVSSYEAASGEAVDRGSLLWWETMGTLTWGVICMAQAASHRSGALRSVELAAIGRRVAEVEWDLLVCLDRADPTSHGLHERSGVDALAQPVRAGSDLHGVPTAAELLEAVREFLERDVKEGTEGRLQFHARVAANVLGMVGRELRLGAAQEEQRRGRLESLGVADEAELAAAIRTGALDDRRHDVGRAVRADVEARLAVANPRYANPGPK